jgi:cytochrome c oxidase cbb3-type subunit III
VNASRRIQHVAAVFAACILIASAPTLSRAAGQQSQAPPSATAVPPAPAPAATATPAAAPDPQQGKRLFAENCSHCHGADAGGGDGPDLHGVVAGLGLTAVQGIIRSGITGTPMPAASTLSTPEIANIAAYLATLQISASTGAVTGDPKKGEALYNSSGCSACHMIAGQGGSVGPELTRIGAARGPSGLKARLIDPGANLPLVGEGLFGSNKWTQYLMFRAVEKDGTVIEGARVGEDSFTIVLKDVTGKLHGLRKPDLRSLEKEPGKSLMPSFKDTLSDTQLDDIVAYLMTLKGAQ